MVAGGLMFLVKNENYVYNALYRNSGYSLFKIIWVLFIYRNELKNRDRVDEIYKWANHVG